jgi:proton glutamate symport protein
MLGLIVCSLIFGLAIAVVGESANIILELLMAIAEIMICITQWIIKLTPIAVLFLIAGSV